MERRSPSQLREPEPLMLDPISEWRAWQALSVYFTVLLNRQIRRRWLLEHKSMEDRPMAEHFRPIIFLEPVPALHKPLIPTNTDTDADTDPALELATTNSKYNPYNKTALQTLKQKVHLLRARVEKGKELASEIERRMQNPRIIFPTHFCHTCVMGGDCVDVLLTKCGHRVCRTCLSFGIDDNDIYECSICFAPASFVAKTPVDGGRRRSLVGGLSGDSGAWRQGKGQGQGQRESPLWLPVALGK